MATTATRFEVTDLKDRIGCVIRTDKQTLLSGERASEIRDLLERRGVIAFRAIDMSDDEQVAFTHTLGTFAHEESEQRPGSEGKDAVYPITMDESINPVASYLKGAFYWHIDGTMSDKPILASIMSSRALSAPGTGQTEFCNTYAAWDELPADEQAALEKLQVHHAMWRSQLYWNPEPSYALLQQWKTRGQTTLPLVWKHRTGRKSLVLGATALQVVGMDWPESEDLLVRLRDWATQDRFVYRHEWTLGDMVIWDNTGTMHRAMAYDHKSGRLMHRTKLEGEEAFA